MHSTQQTIAITGATGFVGAKLVRHFSKVGYKVLAIGRQKTPPPSVLQYASWQQCDITKPIATITADIVIHAAGIACDKGSMHSFLKTNVEGTKHVWNASIKCKRFVFISSSSVYSSDQKEASELDASMKSNLSNYGKSKLLAEQFLINQKAKNKLIIVRPRAIYGTHDRVLLPRILKLTKTNTALLPGSLDILISMTHIDNLVQAIEGLLANKNTAGIYNISDLKPYNLRQVVVSLFNTVHNKELSFKSIPLSFLKLIAYISKKLSIPSEITSQGIDYMSKSLLLNTTKLQKAISYNPIKDFESELPNIYDWVLSVGIGNVKNANLELPWTD